MVYDDQITSGVTERRIGLMASLHAGGERAPGDRLEIAPVRLRHAEALRRVFDTIARERRYLPVFEAPPLDEVRRYIQDAIEKDDPAVVALGDDAVVGWCNIRRDAQPTGAHRGVLGMGVVPSWHDAREGSARRSQPPLELRWPNEAKLDGRLLLRLNRCLWSRASLDRHR